MTDQGNPTPTTPETVDPTPVQPVATETLSSQPTAVDDGLTSTKDDLRLANIPPEVANYLGDKSVCVLEEDPSSPLASDIAKLQNKTGKPPKVLLIDYSKKIDTDLPQLLETCEGTLLVVLCDSEMPNQKHGPASPTEGPRAIEMITIQVEEWNIAHPNKQIRLEFMIDKTWSFAGHNKILKKSYPGAVTVFGRIEHDNPCTTAEDLSAAIQQKLAEDPLLIDFEQNLAELAEEYNAACQAHDETEKGVIFERICQLGAEQILEMKDDPTAKDKIQAIIMKLDINGPKESLYTEMTLHGLGRSLQGLRSTTIEEARNIAFYPDLFKKEFQDMLFAKRGFQDHAAKTGDQTFTDSANWRQTEMAMRVAQLHPVHQRQALEIAEVCFAQFGKELTTGPQALRKAGLREFIAFHREVRREMILQKAETSH